MPTPPAASRLALIGAATLAAGAVQEPVLLRLSGPAAAQAIYTAELTHALELPTAAEHGGSIELTREVRLRYRLHDARPGTGDSVRVVVSIDSARGAVGTPHGRQVLDLRPLVREPLPLLYSRRGGPPQYLAAPPAIDFALLGEGATLAILLDHAFPAMPDRPVRVGETWEHTWVRSEMTGLTATERRMAGRFTLAGIERRGGDLVARIELASRQAPDGPGPAGGDSPSGVRIGQSRATILIGVVDGLIRELSLVEESSGAGEMFGSRRLFGQRTTLRIARVGDTPGQG